MQASRLGIGVLIVLTGGVARVLAAPAVPDAQERATQLVRTLGDRNFKVREQASRELVQLGRAAYQALQTGTQDSDPEVRLRCRKILPLIFELEMKARLEAFVADTNADNDHGLPGWARFRDLVGLERSTRALFANMVKADPVLMEAVESRPNEFSDERLAARCQQLQQTIGLRDPTMRAPSTLAAVAQLLFLGVNNKVTMSQASIAMVNQWLYQPVIQQSLKAGDDAGIVRKLVLAWLDRNIEDVNTGYAITNLLMNTQMKELVEPALKLATNSKGMPHVRASALVAIGKACKDAANVAQISDRLEPLAKDASFVSGFNTANNIRGTTLIGDVALASLIRLSGQQPRDYGYPVLKNNPGWVDSYYYLGFQDDNQRAAARKKWQEFRDQKSQDKK